MREGENKKKKEREKENTAANLPSSENVRKKKVQQSIVASEQITNIIFQCVRECVCVRV